jgi:hypothetical protein
MKQKIIKVYKLTFSSRVTDPCRSFFDIGVSRQCRYAYKLTITQHLLSFHVVAVRNCTDFINKGNQAITFCLDGEAESGEAGQPGKGGGCYVFP